MYPQYMCILLYVTLIWCNGISEIYCQQELGQMYPQYMCILLYMKVIWCNVIPNIYFQLELGVYVSSVYVHSDIPQIYCQLEFGGEQMYLLVYVLSTIYETYLV